MSVKYAALVPLGCGVSLMLFHALTGGRRKKRSSSKKSKKSKRKKDTLTDPSLYAPASSMMSDSHLQYGLDPSVTSDPYTADAPVAASSKDRDRDRDRDELTEDELEEDQMGVRLGVSGALITTAASLSTGYAYLRPDSPNLSDPSSRLNYTLSWQAASLAPLLGTVTYLGYRRFFRADHGMSRSERDKLRKRYARLLQHHLEQTALAVPIHLTLASYLQADQMHIIPLLVSVWLTGQLFYSYEYLAARDDKERETAGSFGFTLSIACSASALAGCLYYLGRALFD